MAITLKTKGEWEIRRGRDGRIYCTCPSWKFSKAPKSCKHLVAFFAEASRPATSARRPVATGIAAIPVSARSLRAAPIGQDSAALAAALGIPVPGKPGEVKLATVVEVSEGYRFSQIEVHDGKPVERAADDGPCRFSFLEVD